MIEELQTRLRSYIDSGKYRTLRHVASESGVSYSTVRRVENGDCKTITLASVLGILSVIADKNDAKKFIAEYFPESARYYLSVLKANHVEDLSEVIDADLEKALYDYEKFFIISLAATERGTTRAYVHHLLGADALGKLDNLLSAGVLLRIDNRVFTKQKVFATCDNSVLAAEINHCTRLIRDANVGKQRQHCALRTHSVTLEGQRAVHQVLEKALLEIEEIVNKNEGNIPIFHGALMGTFLPDGGEHA